MSSQNWTALQEVGDESTLIKQIEGQSLTDDQTLLHTSSSYGLIYPTLLLPTNSIHQPFDDQTHSDVFSFVVQRNVRSESSTLNTTLLPFLRYFCTVGPLLL